MRLQDAEQGRAVAKDDYKQRREALRVELLNAQFDLQHQDFNVLVLIVGDDREGCQEVLDLFGEWMDARHIDVEAFLLRTPEERAHPPFWRYWRAMPPKGRIGLFFGAWAHDAIIGQLVPEEAALDERSELRHIRAFEQLLTADGTLLLKFWLHAPKKALEKRQKGKKKGRPGWHATKRDRLMLKHYDDLVARGEQLIADTEAPYAPWQIVESTDHRHRNLAVMETLLAALQQRIDAPRPAPATPPPPADVTIEPALTKVDLSATLAPDDYDKRLKKLQLELGDLSVQAEEQGLPSVFVFEGWDAAGKGGAIRRMTASMAIRLCRVVSIAAPTDEELARHYLWRFWRHLPRAGRMTVFDRSYYGRVLVERVEGFAEESRWRAAYDEIADFESLLCEAGVVVRKFWLHIDADEQLRRFKAREQTTYKKYKITDEDYRNRDRWDDYTAAIDEMVARTHTARAPWTLVAANDKLHARVTVVESVIESLKAGLR